MSLADAIRILNEKVPPVLSPGNPREPLEALTGAGFPEVPPVPSENSNVQSVGEELPEGDQAGNDLQPANDQPEIIVACWTPSGIRRLVYADSPEHAEWIRAANPMPQQIRCADCQHATVEAGIARCAAGVDSGIPAGGWWATDRHICSEFKEHQHD